MKYFLIALVFLSACTTIQPIEITKTKYVHRVMPSEWLLAPNRIPVPNVYDSSVTQKDVAAFIYRSENRMTEFELQLKLISDWNNETPPKETETRNELQSYKKWFWQ